MKIAIIGAGIMGVTCAVRLHELFTNPEVTIFTDKLSPDTTSDVSAGFWKPYCLDGCSDQLIKKWGKETYDRMIKEAFSKDGCQLGVQTLPAFVLNNTEKVETPFWYDIVDRYRELDMKELSSVCATNSLSDLRSGFEFTTTTVTVNKYIPFYMKYLESKGVKIIQKKLSKIAEFIDATKNNGFDYIINCTGLGALEFCNDRNMNPVRGQVLRVKAPWIKNCVILEHEVTYLLPMSDLVVIGGTQEPGEFSIEPNDDDCKKILERCCQLIPSLKDAEIVGKQAGLRPLRKGGIRLEMEFLKENSNKLSKVIHNYGHGGSGVTLCWGCASEVCDIIRSDLSLRVSSHL